MPNNRRLAIPGTPYLIYYRVTNDALFIRAVWHGARLPPQLR